VTSDGAIDAIGAAGGPSAFCKSSFTVIDRPVRRAGDFERWPRGDCIADAVPDESREMVLTDGPATDIGQADRRSESTCPSMPDGAQDLQVGVGGDGVMMAVTLSTGEWAER